MEWEEYQSNFLSELKHNVVGKLTSSPKLKYTDDSTVHEDEVVVEGLGLLAGSDSEGEESEPPVSFHFWLFFWIIMTQWVLDFGRPVFNFYFRFLPDDMPNVGDFGHLAYNIVVPFLLLLLLERSSRKHAVSTNVKYFLVILLTLGSSLHLVGDSIQSKLIQRCNFDASLKVKDNPVMKALNNDEIVKIFEMGYFYDEHLGHYLWYLPYFAIFVLYFRSCFARAKPADLGIRGYTLLVPGIVFYWYLIVEGQVWPLGLLLCGIMAGLTIHHKLQGDNLDANGRFLALMFGGVLVMFAAWCVWLDVPFSNVYTLDLDGVPEFWETFPALKDMLIRV